MNAEQGTRIAVDHMLSNVIIGFIGFMAGGLVGMGAMAMCAISGAESRQEEQWERQAGKKVSAGNAR